MPPSKVRTPRSPLSSADSIRAGLTDDADHHERPNRKRRRKLRWHVAACVCLVLIICAIVVPIALLGKKKRPRKVAELRDFPPRLLTRLHDASGKIEDFIPVALRDSVMELTHLKQTGMAVLKFDNAQIMTQIWLWLNDKYGDKLQILTQDFQSMIGGSVIHEEPVHDTFHQANNLSHDILHASPRRQILQDQPQTLDQWHLAQTGVQQAWAVSMGEGVVIAIVDTGCDFSHPDLSPNAWVNEGEIPGNGIDDDGNGFVDDVHGWNFGGSDANVTDADGHGTHVASIAAAAGVARVSGVAPRAKIMCLKVQDDGGQIYASYIFGAFEYARSMGAHIISNSYSNTYWSLPQDPAGSTQADQITSFTEAIAVLDKAGILVTAAAGNEQQDNDAILRLGYPNDPTNIDLDNVVSVAATDANQKEWTEGAPDPVKQVPGTNFGLKSVDIGAPGARIVGAQASVRGSAAIESRSGTSMATPFVAGLAALILATLATKDGVYFGRGLELKRAILNSQEPSQMMGMASKQRWSSANVTNGIASLQRAIAIAQTGKFDLFDTSSSSGVNTGSSGSSSGTPAPIDGTLPLPTTPPPSSTSGTFSSQPGAGNSGWDGRASLYPHTVADARVAGVSVRFYAFDDAVDSMQGPNTPLYSTHALKGFDFHSTPIGLEGVFEAGHPMENTFVDHFGVKASSQMWLAPGASRFRLTCSNRCQLYIAGALAIDYTPPDGDTASQEYVVNGAAAAYVDVDVLMMHDIGDHKLIVEVQGPDGGGFREVGPPDVSLHAAATVDGWQHLFDATVASSASFTTANAASNGLLVKAYSPGPPVYGSGGAAQMPEWSDAEVTRAGFVSEFPGMAEGDALVDFLAAAPAVEQPLFVEISGVMAVRQPGVLNFRMQCQGACKLFFAGVLWLDQDGDHAYLDKLEFGVLSVEQPGPFPFRVLYYHSSDDPPGLQLLAKLADDSPKADSASSSPPTPPPPSSTANDFTDTWRSIPAELLFTDACMEHADMHTGSIPGLRVEVWPFGVDIRTATPMATRRLDVGKPVQFDLKSLLDGLVERDYAVLVHGYSALGAPYVAVQHLSGEAVLHVGHTRVLVSSDGGVSPPVTAVPFVIDGDVLYHLHAVFSQVPYDEQIGLLYDTTAEGNVLRPWTVDDSCWCDVRMTAASADDSRIGKLGAFWLTYYPNSSSGYGVKIPNSLDGYTKHSWMASFHSSGTGTALDRPMMMSQTGITDRVTRFSGFYRIVTTGVHGLGLYCLHDDSIFVTLGGVALVEVDRCKPFMEEGIVFQILPMFLPAGFYEFEYTVRTSNATTVMIAEVLRPAPGFQPPGPISAASAVLFMPASANDLITNVPQEDSASANVVSIGVVDHGFGR